MKIIIFIFYILISFSKSEIIKTTNSTQQNIPENNSTSTNNTEIEIPENNKEETCLINEGCLICQKENKTKCSFCKGGFGLENENCKKCEKGEYSFGGTSKCHSCNEYSFCKNLQEKEKLK